MPYVKTIDRNHFMATLSVWVTLLPSTRRASPNVINWNRWDSSACQSLFCHHPNRRILILKKFRMVQDPAGMRESSHSGQQITC